MNPFSKEKADFLSKKDRSRKGKIDEGIKQLVSLINSRGDCYTTSSCAGRIALFSPAQNKRLTKWHFLSHSHACFEEVKRALRSIGQEDVWLRQESFILHVCCKSLADAQRLLGLTAKLGLKRSGITTLKRKIVVELIGTEHFDTIVAKRGKVIASEEFLKVLVAEANSRLRKNSARIRQLETLVKKSVKK